MAVTLLFLSIGVWGSAVVAWWPRPGSAWRATSKPTGSRVRWHLDGEYLLGGFGEDAEGAGTAEDRVDRVLGSGSVPYRSNPPGSNMVTRVPSAQEPDGARRAVA